MYRHVGRLNNRDRDRVHFFVYCRMIARSVRTARQLFLYGEEDVRACVDFSFRRRVTLTSILMRISNSSC